MSVVPDWLGRSFTVAVLVIVAQGAALLMICSYVIVSVSLTSRPRVPVAGGAGLALEAAYGREHTVLVGIAEPTVTPAQENVPLSRPPDDVAPATPIAVTLYAGAGFPLGPAGSVSVSVTVSPRVMTLGPLFLTLTVQVTLPPAFTVGLDTVFVRLRS